MDEEKTSFYDHYTQDKPTKLGMRLAVSLSERIFEFAQIRQGTRVLEIGPGRGIFADVCLNRGAEYWAVEPNEKMASSLEKKGINVTRAMIPPLPTLDKNFDVVAMINVMEHMNSARDALQIACQIKEVLNPEGKLLICSPDYLNLRYNFFNCDFTHNYVTTRRRLRELLISAGFENIRSCYLGGMFSGFLCFIVTSLAGRLPFGLLSAWFPNCKVFRKLYKIQITFSRRVLIIGEKSN